MSLRSPKSFYIFAGAAFFAFSLSVFLFSFPPEHAAAQGVAQKNPSGLRFVRPLEMHIASNGLMLLRNAKVTAVFGTTITVSATWGSADFVWVVHTNGSTYETRNFGTRFLDRDGKPISLADVRIGDAVTITGMLNMAMEEPTIEANSVRRLEE